LIAQSLADAGVEDDLLFPLPLLQRRFQVGPLSLALAGTGTLVCSAFAQQGRSGYRVTSDSALRRHDLLLL
jgi:hypothetical protein